MTVTVPYLGPAQTIHGDYGIRVLILGTLGFPMIATSQWMALDKKHRCLHETLAMTPDWFRHLPDRASQSACLLTSFYSLLFQKAVQTVYNRSSIQHSFGLKC